PPHTYASAGTYNVLLTTTDANGCSATSLSPTTVTVGQTINADFSFAVVGGCGAPLQVNFTDLSTGPGPFSYSWDFGDGSPIDQTQNPSHTYLSNSTFTVTLAIDNGQGCRDTLVMPNAVSLTALNADFAAVPRQACAGTPVNFTDLSTGVPTSWDWDFGDGGGSVAQHPSHAYALPGFYTVELIVHRGPGCADTLVQTNFIEVLPLPTAAFSAANNTGCQAPLPVTFSNSSIGAVSFLWNFGDGNTSTTASLVHAYTAPSNYTVSLTVTGANGCTHTLSQPNLVQIVPPVANFTFTGIQSGCMPRTIMFNDTVFSPFDPVVTWNWDFGDGVTSTNPNHTYTIAGNWTVSLIVFTAGGCSDTVIMPNLISTGPNPVVVFTANPRTVCIGEPVPFNNNSVNDSTWLWDFGDGNTSTLEDPVHAYDSIGNFTVTLTAGNNGCTGSQIRNNYIQVVGSEASFTANMVNACDTPATFNFTNTSSGNNLATYWDFGDGTLANTFHASHVYTATGTYTVQLISEHLMTGCRDTFTRVVSVSWPTAGFIPNANGGCAPLAVQFTSTAVGVATFQWNFGDPGSGGLNVSGLANPIHIYNSSGSFAVQQIVIDSNGCRDTAMTAMPIDMHDVVPDFGASPLLGCPAVPIAFTSLSSSDSPITNWTWNFGDGSPLVSGPVANPLHAYANPGNYTVTMTATDSNGCVDTRMRPNYIVITQPNPNFTQSADTLCPNEPMLVNSTSTGVAPLVHAWTFGDGGLGMGPNASHAYTAAGIYNVQLLVKDDNGCQDSIIRPMVIYTPVAAFSIDDSIADCPPLIANFQIGNTTNISSYSWDFGDGTPLVNNIPNPGHTYNTPGSFAVTLIVRSPTGCADTLIVPARVVVNAPAATFAFDRAVTCPGQPVQYVLNPAGTYLATWDFGDGQLQSGGDTVTHAYQNAGPFTPIVIVIDTAANCSIVAPSQGPIQVLAAPVADFGLSDRLLCLADSVHFSDSTAFGGGPAGFWWTFGDGGVDSVQNPVHFYALPGTYSVSLSVTDTLGCSDQDSLIAAVRVWDYAAGCSISDSIVCPNALVTFSDNSLSDTTIIAWAWDFGDSATGSGPSVSHAYADTGWYDVTLVIMTAAGCTDTLLLPNAVHVQLPTGSFSISTDTTCPGIALQFTFLGGNGIVPTWYFGDGDSLMGGNPVNHAYTAVGSYSATVLMTDSLG
ncbi:MAG TPA: PKD domain-containing protein, partial [Bacteroidia bacterium]|nr:PKD domain-containing protein [Bacteroidia bacterium]